MSMCLWAKILLVFGHNRCIFVWLCSIVHDYELKFYLCFKRRMYSSVFSSWWRIRYLNFRADLHKFGRYLIFRLDYALLMCLCTEILLFSGHNRCMFTSLCFACIWFIRLVCLFEETWSVQQAVAEVVCFLHSEDIWIFV